MKKQTFISGSPFPSLNIADKSSWGAFSLGEERGTGRTAIENICHVKVTYTLLRMIRYAPLLDDFGIVNEHLVLVSRAEVLVLQKDAGDGNGLCLSR